MRVRTRFIVLFGLLFMGMASYIHLSWLPNFLDHEVTAFKEAEQKKLHLLAISLVPDLLTLDMAKIYKTLQEVEQDELDWKRVQLFNDRAMRIYPLRENLETEIFTQIKAPLLLNGSKLGTLTLFLDSAKKIDRLKQFVWNLELTIFSLILVSFGLMYWSINAWIMAPLNLLTMANQAVAGGDFRATLPEVSVPEMNAFRNSFKTMLNQIVADKLLLQESEEFQSAIINSAKYTIISTDSEGLIQSMNAAAEELLGYKAEEIVNKETLVKFHDLDEIIHRAKVLTEELGETVRPNFDVFVLKAVAGEDDVNKWTYITKSHKRIPVSISVTALKDKANGIIGFLGVGTDLTESIKAEKEQQLAKKVFDHAGDAIIITDSDTNILDVNSAFERISGYSKAEVLGSKPNILQSGEHNQVFYQEMWGSLKSKGIWTGEIVDKRKNQEVYHEQLTITEIKDYSGITVNYVGMFQDITLKKATEKALLEKQLLLEEATKAKSDFLANMSHEIRT
ncbi:MAG: PAS domain S-box protein, partial [SAR324 cluster bacterium]|nr:PAS domain S-box protein [SAR324 cluster bacterium]